MFMAFLKPCLAQNFTIAGENFHPAFTNSSDAGYLKEYLAGDQTLNNWTNLFSVRYFKHVDSPKDYIAQMAIKYQQDYPKLPFDEEEQKSKDRWFMTFLMNNKTAGQEYFEWDFFRAQTNAAGGIVVFQYAERIKFKKPKDVDNWNIRDLRHRMIPILATNEFTIE
jgi:hypothetical protein